METGESFVLKLNTVTNIQMNDAEEKIRRDEEEFKATKERQF